MTRAGILYACRSLAMSHISTTNANLNPLKGDISNIIAELAFRQWLGGCGIQYQLIHAAPFSQPHIDEVLLNGRRCHLTNYPLSQIGKNDPIKRNLAGLLSAPACLAETTMNSDHLGPNDLLFFSFMSVQPDLSRQEQRQTATTGSGNFFIYILPRRWLSLPTRASWRLSNASPDHFDVEVGGVSLERTFMSRTIHLLPHETAEIDPKFSRVVFLSMSQVPIGAISIQRGLRDSLQITPNRWGNLWITVQAITLAGCIPVGEFRRKALRSHRPQPPWDRLPLPPRGYALPISKLSPCAAFMNT